MKIKNFTKVIFLLLIALSVLFASTSKKGESRTKADDSAPGLAKQNISEALQTPLPYHSMVIARFIETKVVRKINYYDEVIKSNDLSKVIGGRVHTFEIRDIICRSGSGKTDSTTSVAKRVFFFNEQGSGFYQPYEVDKDYLLYLSPFPDQKKLKKDFELDKNLTYYNPYPFDGEKRTKDRVREISSKMDQKLFSQLTEQCREQKY